MKWRIHLLILIFFAAYLGIAAHLYKIQLNQEYVRRAQSQTMLSSVLAPTRGIVYFTNENESSVPMALNKEFSYIYAVPAEILKAEKDDPLDSAGAKRRVAHYAEILSPILQAKPEVLEQKLNKPHDPYELLKEKADKKTVAQIKDLKLKGIYIAGQLSRYYPFREQAAHVLGFVGPPNEDELARYGHADVGRYGVEAFFQKELLGTPGQSNGTTYIAPERGKDIRLTIDQRIQVDAEEVLKSLIKNYKAKAGTIIVQEPSTGKILAMTSAPTFDPNNYGKYELENFKNPAVQAIYEPGSVFKIFTLAAGIDAGVITPETTFVDKGKLTFNTKTIRNWDREAHGTQNMVQVLEKSINTGAVFVEQKVGHAQFYEYLKQFGFDTETGIQLPGEVKSRITNLVRGQDIEYATASYGQGVSITPIALIRAVSAIANKGMMMKPLIRADEEPEQIRQVIAPQNARTVVNMLVDSIKDQSVAAIANYSIAGKTGTALVPDFTYGGYTNNVINTYAGFAPAYNPKFSILIKIEEPEGNPFAGETVAPAFNALAQSILKHYGIPPDRL